LGLSFPLVVNLAIKWITSPLGTKFAPRGEIKNWPQEHCSKNVNGHQSNLQIVFLKKFLGWEQTRDLSVFSFIFSSLYLHLNHSSVFI
jgi:hypothetical protein